jgi:hypothetical protein
MATSSRSTKGWASCRAACASDTTEKEVLNERGHSLRYDAYAPTAQLFTVGGVTAQTLGAR